ncbi:hypothetical protein SAMN05192550_1635 [Flavobacterium glycines]|uniref:TonB C-terminal domain-containing protein n=1 Tax=Flavobacterium glycines TaxID=551990 RepID=A0A1B9DY86_9FLAO|nr:hypothetical protein [Flavobacterium glycines]OCB74655.1 hypothetical protein FBGL_01415 [Flavobacterium glycines]GEL09369.1 hypothetical protein FGL01_01080 [Flavobacterium glycines]SDJ09376.1 hypothetical protein SAMN05192550_1635 [Flavobacterium glycines]
MKKLFLSVIVALFMSSAFAATGTPTAKSNSYGETFKELTKLLNTYPKLEDFGDEVVVKVKIAINENHEIVVMSTNTSNEDLKEYIKNTLNYQKLLADELEVGNGLVFMVRFVK